MIGKSLTAKILVWCIAVLLLSSAGFVVVSVINMNHIAPYFIQVNSLERDDAIQAYERGGAKQLAEYLERLHRYIPVQYILTDASGRDLATGNNRVGLLAPGGSRYRPGKDLVFVSRSRDQRYCFVVIVTPQSIWTFLPFYFMVPLAVCLLGWTLAVQVASPLRRMAHVVARFGRGDLAVRMRSNRKDEIGGVARAFDEMADRMETLLAAERRLLQDVAHELRTPLTRIAFAAALTKTAEDREEAAQRVNKEISRLAELVNSLLQVTRAEGDPSTHIKQKVSIQELVRDVMQDCQIEADAHGCSFVTSLRSSEYLYGDYELLRRASENIVRNAIKYAPADTHIEVNLETVEGVTKLSVRDYGPGVPEDAISKLFQPFFRVDPARDSATGGVGLGLAIASRAITVHGGSITARNAQPGLLVCVELPLESDK